LNCVGAFVKGAAEPNIVVWLTGPNKLACWFLLFPCIAIRREKLEAGPLEMLESTPD